MINRYSKLYSIADITVSVKPLRSALAFFSFCILLLSLTTVAEEDDELILTPPSLPPTSNGTLDEFKEIHLPELGDSSSSLISLDQEYVLGRAWLMSFRSQVPTIYDPLLQDYLEGLIYSLATHSQLKDRRLDLVIVDNPSMNAFAVPGGVIGINTGLFLYADTEGQMSSVLTHELAHVSQRHFARSVEEQQRNAIPNMAGLLAGIVLAATVGGDAGLAAITATQAASLQNQLRFSRQNEQEADRIGMQTLVKADMDPNAASAMFENMMAASRYAGNRPPEFLMSHPVTESRISDAANRARQYSRKMYTENIVYQLMRARVEVELKGGGAEAAKFFQARLYGKSPFPVADQYGLVLALTEMGEYQRANNLLKPLIQSSPNQAAYITAQADIDIAAGRPEKAITLLNKALAISPGSHPLTMTLADAYLKAKQPHRAEALLQEHVKQHPKDPYVWYVLAETHGLAGNIVGVHQSRAEYFLLNGQLSRAQTQLNYALPLVKGDNLTTIQIKERIKQIGSMKTALKNM